MEQCIRAIHNEQKIFLLIMLGDSTACLEKRVYLYGVDHGGDLDV